MLKFLLSLSLLTTLHSYAQEDPSQTSLLEESYSEIYSKLNVFEELYLYLLNQDDLTIQLSIPTYSYRKFTKEYTQTYKQVLKQAINIESSPFVIFRADLICHAYSSLTEWCHKLDIHEIHQKIDPDNILSYLLNLHKNDPNNQQQLIVAAKYGRFSNSFYQYNTLELSEYIQDYINDNPEFLIEDENDSEIDDAFKEVAIQQFIAKGLSTKEELLSMEEQSNINIQSLTIGMYMANVMSNYHSTLYKTCQLDEVQNECITIAKVLAKDKTLFIQSMASRLFKQQYEKVGLDDKILKLEEQQKAFYKKIGCYSVPDVNIAIIINEEISKFYLKNLKEFGEIQALKLLAFKVYNIEKEHGYNPDFNPNDCE